MRKLGKGGVLTLSAVLSFGILAPTVSATTFSDVQQERVQIRIATTSSEVTKNMLIEKFKKLFPGKFDFLHESDFDMNNGHYYPNDDTIRYNLTFHKEMDGQQIYGSIGFYGENLQIEQFNFEPAKTVDALFPPKVKEEQAAKIAQAFLSKFPEGKEYQLDKNFSYYSGNLTLTEPIRYSFSFVHTKNNVPISDQRIHVTVLGDGQVISFYRTFMDDTSQTYDDVTKVMDANEILAKVKKNFSADLQYLINFDYQTGNRSVKLVYQPTSRILGINAITGEWRTIDGFTPDIPKEKEMQLITDEPLQPKDKAFSVEKAKAFAEKLLAIDSDKVTLNIESIDETKNQNGQDVISVQYTYQYRNGGTGTNLELDKQTGEIVQYNDIKSDVLERIGEESKINEPISREKALEQAIKYLKEYAPSHLHNYAMPTENTGFNKDRGIYYFNFPRIVNGIPVSGNQIFVSVFADGSLQGLNVDYQDIHDWPSSKNIISKEEARTKFLNELNLDLRYERIGYTKDDNHYLLIYNPIFKDGLSHFIDAKTGEWEVTTDKNDGRQVVTHSWAKDELNYLINAGILKVADEKKFDANAHVTKGDAIEVIMKSLTRFYDGYFPNEDKMSQTFKNIGPDYPLYQVIERAVAMGILDSKNANFDVGAPLTREELAVWYIRALGLELAAKHNSIYKLTFADANKVKTEDIGYVALANSLGLLMGNHNHFYPDRETTYAELAVSVFRLAYQKTSQ